MISVLFNFLIIPILWNPGPEIFWEPDEMKGKVKYMLESHYYTSNNYSKVELGFQNEYKFNKDGSVKSHTQYDKEEQFRNETILEYDKKSKKRLKAVERDKEGEITKVTDYKYDMNGRLSAEWVNFLNVSNHSYLDQVFGYDNRGNQIKLVVYNSKGEINHEGKYEFDENNKLVTAKMISTYYGKSRSSTTTNIRNDKGLVIERKRVNNGSEFDRHWTYKYDEFGNQVELKSFNEDGSLKLTQIDSYEYDDHNNWVKKITMDNVDTTITKRLIKYY